MRLADLKNSTATSSNFVAKVTALSEITTGYKVSGEKWLRCVATIQDVHGGQTFINLWNEDVGLLESGITYHFEQVKKTIWKGNINLQVGPDTIVTPTVEQKLPPVQDDDTPYRTVTTSADLLLKVNKKVDLLYQINTAVTERLKQYTESPNNAMIGMYTKIIYDDVSKGVVRN